jgi:hypothetical protein
MLIGALLVLPGAHGTVAQEASTDLSAAWQDALEKTEAKQTSEAIAAFVALDRQMRVDRDNAMAQLTRYFILHTLAEAGRYREVVSRFGIVRAEDLPEAFRLDLVRMEAEARLETGDAQSAASLLEPVRFRTGRMHLLYGRALAATGRAEAARDAIAQGLISADDAGPAEKQKASAALARLLEADGRLGEAERIARLAAQVYPGEQADSGSQPTPPR